MAARLRGLILPAVLTLCCACRARLARQLAGPPARLEGRPDRPRDRAAGPAARSSQDWPAPSAMAEPRRGGERIPAVPSERPNFVPARRGRGLHQPHRTEIGRLWRPRLLGRDAVPAGGRRHRFSSIAASSRRIAAACRARQTPSADRATVTGLSARRRHGELLHARRPAGREPVLCPQCRGDRRGQNLAPPVAPFTIDLVRRGDAARRAAAGRRDAHDRLPTAISATRSPGTGSPRPCRRICELCAGRGCAASRATALDAAGCGSLIAPHERQAEVPHPALRAARVLRRRGSRHPDRRGGAAALRCARLCAPRDRPQPLRRREPEGEGRDLRRRARRDPGNRRSRWSSRRTACRRRCRRAPPPAISSRSTRPARSSPRSTRRRCCIIAAAARSC